MSLKICCGKDLHANVSASVVSDTLSEIGVGEVVTALEMGFAENGTHRIKTEHGWINFLAGELEQVEEEETAEGAPATRMRTVSAANRHAVAVAARKATAPRITEESS